MKKLSALSLLAVGAIALAPKPAVAGDKGLAILGGFLGGLIVANSVNNADHTRVYVDAGCPPPPPVPASVVVVDDGGYWQESYVQVWIAPSYVVAYDSWHRPIRRYVAGHYERRPRRVWIADNRYHSRGGFDHRYDHNDRRDRGHDDHRDDHRNDRHDRGHDDHDRRDHR